MNAGQPGKHAFKTFIESYFIMKKSYLSFVLLKNSLEKINLCVMFYQKRDFFIN